MQIQKTGQNSSLNFRMNMKYGSGLKEANLPKKLVKQLEELKLWLAEMQPLRKDVFVDFEQFGPNPMKPEGKSNFQYFIKPFCGKDDYIRYTGGDRFSSKEEFLNQDLPKRALGLHALTISGEFRDPNSSLSKIWK